MFSQLRILIITFAYHFLVELGTNVKHLPRGKHKHTLPGLERPGKGVFFALPFLGRFFLRFGYYLLCNVARHFFIVIESHGKRAPALSNRP